MKDKSRSTVRPNLRIGDELFFSPKHRFSELDFEDSSMIVDAFRERVRSYYLQPASHLLDKSYPFAAGALCCVTIDFLARYTTGESSSKQRVVRWLSRFTPEFKSRDPRDNQETLATRFYNDFRNGLVHEGRIKNLGEFSLEHNEIVHSDEGTMSVNPKVLLERIAFMFEEYCKSLDSNLSEVNRLTEQLKYDFRKELKAIQQD